VPQKPPREIRPFLEKSPLIETQDPKIRALAREVVGRQGIGLGEVEAIYDWVRDNIEYRNGKLKGAAAALRTANGDCEELTSLFIALLSRQRVPARTVWVPGHCYPEFLLQDKEARATGSPARPRHARFRQHAGPPPDPAEGR